MRAIVVDIVSFIALVSVLLYISWQAFLILSIIIPLATFASIKIGSKIRSLTSIERDTEASVINILTKSVGAFKIVRRFSLMP